MLAFANSRILLSLLCKRERLDHHMKMLPGPAWQAMHYPNPPNPDKVLYINKKEAPLLKVERGVPVTFSAFSSPSCFRENTAVRH